MNLGMSENFGTIDYDELTFPAYMEIDYIRVYQPKGEKNIGCNPSSFPTEDYINTLSFSSFFYHCGKRLNIIN